MPHTHNPFRLNDAEFEPLRTEFLSIIGEEFLRRKVAAHFESHVSHGSINQMSVYHLGLYHALQNLLEGKVKSVVENSFFSGTWFLIKFVVLAYRHLDEFGKRRLVGMLYDGLGTNGDLHRLLSELFVYFDYQWLGLRPHFVDLNGLGQYDMIVRDGDDVINVEVKTLSISRGDPWSEKLVRRVSAQLYDAMSGFEYSDGELFTIVLLGRAPDAPSVINQLASIPSIMASGARQYRLPDMVFLRGKAELHDIEELESQEKKIDGMFYSNAFGGSNPALAMLRRKGAKAVLRVRFNEPRLFGRTAKTALKGAALQLPQDQLGVIHLHLVDVPSFESFHDGIRNLTLFQDIEAAFCQAVRGRGYIASLTLGGMLSASVSKGGNEIVIGGRMSAQIPNRASYPNAVRYRDRILDLTRARRG